MRRIPHTDLDVFPLCLGGNVFGWTADEHESFAVLDALRRGGRQLHRHRRRLLGLGARAHRGRVGNDHRPLDGRARHRGPMVDRDQGRHGAGAEGPVRRRRSAPRPRLRCGGSASSSIDLYYAHADDPDDAARGDAARLRRARQRRQGPLHRGVELHGAAPGRGARSISDREGLARYVALQPHYNLMHRGDYEGELRDLCEREGLACVPYFALAKGFLTGKYRPGTRWTARVRTRRAPISTSAACACWPRSTRSRPRTARPSPRWRSPGCLPSRRSSRPSPAPARCATCRTAPDRGGPAHPRRGRASRRRLRSCRCSLT